MRLLLVLLIFPALAYELVTIQTISLGGKTFVTRQGKDQGIRKGMECTFTSNLTSIAVVADLVTKDHTVWKILEPNGVMPFDKNQIVTFNFGTEKVWMLDPEDYLAIRGKGSTGEKGKIEETAEERYARIKKWRDGLSSSFSFAATYVSGVAQSVSRTNSDQITSRNGNQFQFEYDKNVWDDLFLGVGMRQDSMVTDSTTFTAESTRTYFTLQIRYNLIPINKIPLAMPYMGITLGFGFSKTRIAGVTSTGSSSILPKFRAGAEILMKATYALFLEGSLETTQTKEAFANGTTQSTSEINFGGTAGFRKYF